MSALLHKKSRALRLTTLLVVTTLGIVAALLWAQSSRQQAGERAAAVEPWQEALMQVQDSLQIEREAVQALSQTVAGLQTALRDIQSRLDAQQSEQSNLSGAIQTAYRLAQSAQTASVAGEARFGTLQTQLALLEQRMPPSKPTPVAKPVVTRPAAKPAPLIPPFRVLDVEYRGGERFLAIAPKDSHSLASVHLIREGDKLAGWQLAWLSPQQAVFTVGSRQHRVDLQPVLSVN